MKSTAPDAIPTISLIHDVKSPRIAVRCTHGIVGAITDSFLRYTPARFISTPSIDRSAFWFLVGLVKVEVLVLLLYFKGIIGSKSQDGCNGLEVSRDRNTFNLNV